MNIILSTRNPSKALQIQELFKGTGVTVLSLDDVGIEGEGIEDGTTLEENAFKKAEYAREHSEDAWAMADDTGLFITALNGEPGIHAARWAGDVSTDEITQYTLQRLHGQVDRSATFRTVVVLLSPEGDRHVFEGEVMGSILEAPAAPAQPKMPYSPLFVPDGHAKCWSEMTTEEENSISHRGIAFRKVHEFLKQLP